ncbi:MAG: VOC family protein [Solirubrobacteraceae bacterium]
MIHHVAVDVPAGELDAAVAFWALLGFEEVPPPDALRGRWRWVERAGGQLHLRGVEATAPAGAWHVAVVVPDHEAAIARLAATGFAYEPGSEHWGEPRGKTTAPGGTSVELMAAPPPPTR